MVIVSTPDAESRTAALGSGFSHVRAAELLFVITGCYKSHMRRCASRTAELHSRSTSVLQLAPRRFARILAHIVSATLQGRRARATSELPPSESLPADGDSSAGETQQLLYTSAYLRTGRQPRLQSGRRTRRMAAISSRRSSETFEYIDSKLWKQRQSCDQDGRRGELTRASLRGQVARLVK